MATATMMLFVVMVVMMFTVVMATATMMLFVVMVVMMLTVMAAAAMLVMVVIMVVFFLHLGQFSGYLGLALHRFHQLGAGNLIPRGSDDCCLSIEGTKQLNGGIQLLLGDAVSTGQNNGIGSLDLIIVKLAKVLHIDFYLTGIHNGYLTTENDILIGYFLHSSNHIRQFTYAGGFDDNAIGVIVSNHLGQSLAKIAHQTTTDTAGIHLGNVDARILQESAVDTDFAKFVFNQHQLLAGIVFCDHFLDKGGFTGA